MTSLDIESIVGLQAIDTSKIEGLNDNEEHPLVDGLVLWMDAIGHEEALDLLLERDEIGWVPMGQVYDGCYCDVRLGEAAAFVRIMDNEDNEDGSPQECCAVALGKTFVDDDGYDAVSISSLYLFEGGSETAGKIYSALAAKSFEMSVEQLILNAPSVSPEMAIEALLRATRVRNDISAYLDAQKIGAILAQQDDDAPAPASVVSRARMR